MSQKEPRMPDPMMGWLLRRVLDPSVSPESHLNRTRLGMLAGWTGVMLSLLLSLTKGWLGWVSGSVSMLADATNNLADVGSSLVIALGFQWSRKPQDEKHPFGHGRIEAVATLVLSIALILVGAEVARSGIVRLIRPQPIDAPGWLLVTSVVTVGVKTWMALFARALAKMTKSQTLEADAWNHAFDIVCTLMVVLALICSRFGWGALDGWMAVGVAFFILYTGTGYAREAIDNLLGEKPDPTCVREVYKAVVEMDPVFGVHDIMIHQYGDVRMVSFHIEVDANLSLMDAHTISEAAEAAVESMLGWRAVAHLDPVDRSHPLFDKLSALLKTFVADDPRLADMHDLRAEGAEMPYSVSFDLVADMEVARSDYDEIQNACISMLRSELGPQIGRMEIGVEAAVESAPMARRVFEGPC